jgi:hypothetical protein
MIPTFTPRVKRHHRRYTPGEVDDVLNYLRKVVLERGAMAKIARETGILAATLLDWHGYIVANENWFPLAPDHSILKANP